jgi:dTDP-4-amino-4,6-dideoxy-D-galactose acyltransferase
MLFFLKMRGLFFIPRLVFYTKKKIELTQAFLDHLLTDHKAGLIESFGSQPQFFIRYLEWDSQYFKCPTYKLEFAEWEGVMPFAKLAQGLINLKNELATRHPQYYLFTEIPSQDLIMVQALGEAGMKLIETRVTFFHDNLDNFTWEERFPVRIATEMDIPKLKQVAKTERNIFDRCHADPFFSDDVADEYLATFIENSVKGFTDIVLVPEDGTHLPGAFLSADYMTFFGKILGKNLGRMGITAVSREYRGWFIRLMVELFFLFKSKNVSLVYTNTQSTNYAIIRSFEKLGWKYGRCAHVFSVNKK